MAGGGRRTAELSSVGWALRRSLRKVQSGSEPEVRPAQVFVDPSPVRAGLVRWIGRAVAFVIVAYLVLLGASLARAPWAPRLSLPGIGPVVAPNVGKAPPQLGAGAVSTPVPPAVVAAGHAGAGSAGGLNNNGANSSGGASASSSTTTTSAPGNSGHSSTTTTRSTPGVTAPGRRATTTTTIASGTAVTTTTRAHGRGKP